MIRLATAVAAIALLAGPALAQDVSSGRDSQTRIKERSGIQQDQTAETPSGSTTSESMSSQQQPGQVLSRPADCLPNDPRPECGGTSDMVTPEQSDQQLGQTPGSEPDASEYGQPEREREREDMPSR
ncbi:MAG TPA: hypothetical protein VLL76_00395 [Candidatus Omnitrophota bacterium]|nr:hypothetical protein [Candidatus Omnitrophota bacterium]